jgi:hypothetical protein
VPRYIAFVSQRGDPPSSRLCRAFGLAAVAAELKLQVTEAIETGAAMLFLAGYGPRQARCAATGRHSEKRNERTGRRRPAKLKRSARLRSEQPAVTPAAN